MRIIISPAKKMVSEMDLLPIKQMPTFLKEAENILNYMKVLSYEEQKTIWKCNDKIAQLNHLRVSEMDLNSRLSPAILSYEGIQYQYMAPKVLDQKALDYLEEHLRILSGFYGMLRPFDGIVPYRLEMQARLAGFSNKTLYEFWNKKLAEQLGQETSLILNLASKEYSKAVSPNLDQKIAFVSCIFGELVNDKVVEKGTMCKMARGEMVRYLAENQINDIDEIKKFDRLGFSYYEGYSDRNTIVFIKEGKKED